MRISLRNLIMDDNKNNNDEQFEVVEGSEPNYNISEVKDNYLIDSHDLNLPENNKNIFIPKGSSAPVVKESAEHPIDVPKAESPTVPPSIIPVETHNSVEPIEDSPKVSNDNINIEDLLSSITIDTNDTTQLVTPEEASLESPVDDLKAKGDSLESPKSEQSDLIIESTPLEDPKPVDTPKAEDSVPPPPLNDDEFDAAGIDNLLNTLLGNNTNNSDNNNNNNQ